MQRFRWGLIKTLEFLNSKKPGLEMTPSLLKKLLQFEQRLETDMTNIPLSKDWNSFYVSGKHYGEELLIANSYSNSMKSELNLLWVPRKPSHRKKNGIRWRDYNDVFVEGSNTGN